MVEDLCWPVPSEAPYDSLTPGSLGSSVIIAGQLLQEFPAAPMKAFVFCLPLDWLISGVMSYDLLNIHPMKDLFREGPDLRQAGRKGML